MAQDLATVIHDLARPLAEEAGLELVDVDVNGGGGRIRVRVVVDRKGGVDLGSCRTLSKAISRAMDDEDPVTNRYTLEVTSPGTDRPLTDQRSFDRVEGRLVAVTVRTSDDGAETEQTAVVSGTVIAAPDDHVIVRDDAETDHEIPYGRIVKATQVLRW